MGQCEIENRHSLRSDAVLQKGTRASGVLVIRSLMSDKLSWSKPRLSLRPSAKTSVPPLRFQTQMSEITAEEYRGFRRGAQRKKKEEGLLDYAERGRIILFPLWGVSSVGRAADS